MVNPIIWIINPFITEAVNNIKSMINRPHNITKITMSIKNDKKVMKYCNFGYFDKNLW